MFAAEVRQLEARGKCEAVPFSPETENRPAFSFSTMRRLALHASALSDAEYDLYTTILRDITLADDDHQRGDSGAPDDTHFEDMNIGVREARAWLRGRYSHLPASTIDKARFLGVSLRFEYSRFLQILKLFSPNLGHDDTISGSEFFAALRLVIHAEGGKDVERSLAFVQGAPPI